MLNNLIPGPAHFSPFPTRVEFGEIEQNALALEFRQVLNIEQIRQDGFLYGCESSSKCRRKDAMLTSLRDKFADPEIVALVELDMQKMRLRIVLTRAAISERLRELERPKNHPGERPGVAAGTKECGP